MNNKSFEFKIGVIGLGYVGTPLACLFSKKYLGVRHQCCQGS